MDVPGEYVIARMGWRFIGSLETPEEERARYSALAQFLEAHDLATRHLVNEDGQVEVDFALRRQDLTPEGFALMRKPSIVG